MSTASALLSIQDEHRIVDTCRYLNIGCGVRFDERWLNVDLHASHPNVQRHDVLSGPLPFAERSLAVVYHAHLLEHLPRDQAPRFLRECYRLLQPGGIVRVVVPDLEGIVRLYLDALTSGAHARHEWLLLEMYDQVVRDRSGGGMLDYLRRHPEDDFALERLGADGPRVLASSSWVGPGGGTVGRPFHDGVEEEKPDPSWWSRCRSKMRCWASGRWWRDWCVRRLLGAEHELLTRMRFRQTGELHRWMYDRFNLHKLLQECGFVAMAQVDAWTSRIPHWQSFHLDTEHDGSPSKPDSLYMEALRP